jgi:hypothetical protein
MQYSQKMARKICDAIASSRYSLTKICSLNPDFPTADCIYKWRAKYDDFREMYNDARKMQAELGSDIIKQVVEELDNYVYIDDKGNKRIDASLVNMAKVKISAEQWISSRLAGNLYTDKKQLEHDFKNHERYRDNLRKQGPPGTAGMGMRPQL